MRMLIGVIGTLLVISISWNIVWCVSRCLGKGICQSKKRQRQSLRQMEENPIYGNLSYVQTSMPSFPSTDSTPQTTDQQRVHSDSQSKIQDCYANLTLKAPRLQSDHSSPKIEYSDVVQLEKLPESSKEDEDGTDAIATVSDLYASVQSQRCKTIAPSVGKEEYANHL
ncbi:signaling threshold-regulating transmembrane adapter 1-like isoform X2 [Antennarius striatus]